MNQEELQSMAETIFTDYPARFNGEEKTAFLRYARSRLIEAGYSEKDVRIDVHRGVMTSRNLVIGNPAARYIFTAHYDTPGRNGFLLRSAPLVGQTGANIIMMLHLPAIAMLFGFFVGKYLKSGAAFGFSPVGWVALIMLLCLFAVMILPMLIKNKTNRNDNTSGVLGVLSCAINAAENERLREQCCFILFDNEEWGMIGSAKHAAWCKKADVDTSRSMVINLDCIGVGEKLVAASTVKKTAKMKSYLDAVSGHGYEIKDTLSQLVYMSDHAAFQNSVMLCYMKRSKLGPLYIPNIHCSRDTACDVKKVYMLSSALLDSII